MNLKHGFLKNFSKYLQQASMESNGKQTDRSGNFVNYETGQITLNSLDIASISNIRGSISDKVEITVSPSSNDVVPVRDQILEIDIENSIVNVSEDTFVGGSSEAGVGYTTSSSY